MALNDEILIHNNRDWWDLRPIPPEWFCSEKAAEFAERAAVLIDEEYGGARLLAIKDPRLCLLAPIYLAALQRLGMAPRFIIPLRHPAEVAQSITVRDGTDIGSGELLWMCHLLQAELATRDCPRVWLCYDALLSDWHEVIGHIAATLDLTWPVAPELVADEVTASLEPGLRHFDARLAGDLQAGWLAAQLWQAAQHGIAGEETKLREAFDASRWILADIGRLFGLRLQKDREKEAESRRVQEIATAKMERAYAELARINEVMLNGHNQMLAAFAALEATKAERDAALAELARLRALLPAGTSD